MANNKKKKKTTTKKPQTSKKKKVSTKKRYNNNYKKKINNDEIRKEDKSLDIAVYNSKKHTNTLKEYDLKKRKNKNKRKNNFNKIKSVIEVIFEVIVLLLSYLLYFILYPIKMLITGICKVIKKIPKKIKKIKIKQYNRNRKKKNSKTVSKLPKKHNERIVKQKKKIKINDDELILLHYRDYKGIKKIYVFFQNRLRVMKFDMRRFKKKFKYGTLKDKLLIIIMILLIIFCCLLVVGCVYIVISAPDPSSNKLFHSNASVLLYKNDQGEWEEFARLGSEKREKITYDQIPEVLIDAIIATEDSRYFQHDGIDIARFTKATIGQLIGQSNAGGGSTLTMQVSKNNFTSKKASGIEGIIRKFTDIYLSVFVLEKKYTKEEIMEFYVNYPYLGSYSYGVEQACNSYFGKSATDLNLVEAATIAGLFQAPYSYDPYLHPVASEKRRNTVLNLMYRHGYITEEERDTAQAIPLQSTLTGKKPTSNNKYQDFIDTLIEYIEEDTGYDPTTTAMRVYTTLKPNKQEVVESVINGESYKWLNDDAQAGIVVTDVKTGAIVAVGASRDPAARVLNFATGINRHPGSTAKPVLDYGPAFEYLNWSTGQTVIDDEIEYSGGYGSVRNFDKKFKGIMTAKTALAQSRNVPALLTFRQTTNEQKVDFSNKLGWHAEDKRSGVIYESASIGGFEGVDPVRASAAYATFARGGTFISPYIYEKIEFLDTDQVQEPKINKVNAMSEETAYLINNILQYAVTSGTISAAKSNVCETAAKTGTSTVPASSKEKAGIKGDIVGNSWLNVYSTDYSISTWYGYKDEVNPKAYLTSNESSSERKKITRVLVAGIMESGAKFEVPTGIVTAEVELETDPLELASPYTPDNLRSKEIFKKGTVPESVSTRFAQLSNPSNLRYSSDGTNITLTWNAAATPDAINTEYLRNYFASSPIYSTWGDKYLNRRIKYNNDVFGAFGYEVYMVNEAGTIDLGFTTNTTFTVRASITPNTKFLVKSSYQKFKSNQSPGIYTTANGGGSQQPTNSMSIQYNGETCSSKAAAFFQNDTRNRIKVLMNNQDITNKATISNPVCRDESGNEINCRSIVGGKKYTATYTIRYNGENRNKQITISPSC